MNNNNTYAKFYMHHTKSNKTKTYDSYIMLHIVQNTLDI